MHNHSLHETVSTVSFAPLHSLAFLLYKPDSRAVQSKLVTYHLCLILRQWVPPPTLFNMLGHHRPPKQDNIMPAV